MTKLIVLLITLTALLLSGSAAAVDGVDCELSVFQFDQVQQQQVLLWSDTSQFVDSLSATGFLVAFSVDLQFERIDTGGCAFTTHVVTLGNPANNYARQFRSEYGLTARMDNIVGKNGVNYTLAITPLGKIDIDTVGCGFEHRNPDQFRFDPSGYMDIYYATNTYADFYWNNVKGIFEERYRLFMSINNFNLPGKYLIYLCPCPLYSIIWDDRFGTSVDPTRNVAFSIYNRDINSADPFIVLQASVYKNYGYAPAFLTEGMAGYLSLGAYEMKRLVAAGENVPLQTLMDTYQFYQTDPNVADKTASTFVKYLINQYKIDKLLKVYRQADDLTLQAAFEEVYEKPLADLETEWLHWVDTTVITADQYRFYRDLAEAMFDFRLMQKYGEELLPSAATRGDTSSILAGLVRASFFAGDYYAATDYQQQLLQIADTVAAYRMSLAAYQMMNGLYDEAAINLEKASSLDSADQLIQFNQAIHAMAQGDEDRAMQFLSGIILSGAMTGPQSEARVLLGSMLAGSEDENDQAKASQYCVEALNSLAQAINSGSSSPTAHIWAGIGYVGMGDIGSAREFLETAVYLETRPFYVGLASLWLGKVSDIRGEHDVARDYYGYVLAIASADYHQQEARKYMEQPYQQ